MVTCVQEIRAEYNRRLIANCGCTKESAEEILAMKYGDFVSFGRLYLSNPDCAQCHSRAGEESGAAGRSASAERLFEHDSISKNIPCAICVSLCEMLARLASVWLIQIKLTFAVSVKKSG